MREIHKQAKNRVERLIIVMLILALGAFGLGFNTGSSEPVPPNPYTVWTGY